MMVTAQTITPRLNPITVSMIAGAVLLVAVVVLIAVPEVVISLEVRVVRPLVVIEGQTVVEEAVLQIVVDIEPCE